jgi:hypothetical protein
VDQPANLSFSGSYLGYLGYRDLNKKPYAIELPDDFTDIKIEDILSSPVSNLSLRRHAVSGLNHACVLNRLSRKQYL